MIDPLVIIVVIVIALAFNLPFAKLKIPPIIGYIFTGIVVSNIFHIDKHAIELFAEFGIVFLMFMIGLEFSLERLISMKKEVLFYGFLEVFVVGIITGIWFYMILDIDIRVSLILGSAIALSSTAIVLKLLNENREIAKPYGRNALGILLFQDIAVIPLLIAISIIANKDANLTSLAVKTIIEFSILIVIIYVFGKYIAPVLLKAAASTKSDEIFILSVLLIVLGAAETAHAVGLSYTLGAFLAGMILSETNYKYQIEADLTPFRDLLLGIFFLSVGLMVDIEFVKENWLTILAMAFALIVLKLGIIYFLFRIIEKRKRVAIKTALVLSQIGEFAFVIFSMLEMYDLAPSSLLQKLVMVTVISMILTPFIIKYISVIADLFDKETEENLRISTPHFSDHIVIVGYDDIGKRVAKNLKERNIKYIVVERQIELVKEGIKNGINIIFGNATRKPVLEHLNIKDATSIIITTQNEEHTEMIVESVLSINPNLNIIVVTNSEEEKELYASHHNIYIVDKNKELAEELINLALSCKMKG